MGGFHSVYGFVGFLSNEKLNKQDINTLNLMIDSICHGGPDSRRVYSDENMFLGFVSFNTTELENEKQLFSYENEDYYLVSNGKIYNYSQLREKLIAKGVDFNTDTETEVILALYQYMGKGFVEDLRGMFAFIIWDKMNKTLFGARDSFGIKPLYYMETQRGLYFTSEPTSFSYNPDTCYEIDRISLQNYLTYQYVPEPNTIMTEVYTLEPGCTVEKKFGKENAINIDRYWSIQLNPIKQSKNKRIHEIREALRDSVEHHMRENAPIGSFLSGGIDSAIVVALAKQINPSIKTFTAGFKVDGYNEIGLAEKIANEFKVENISKVISPEEFVEELPNIVWYMGVPVADPSAIPLYFISREAKKHVAVVLSGEGSDELFGGYNIYREPFSLSVFSYIPRTVKNVLISIANLIPDNVKGKSFITRGCTPIEKRYAGNAHIFKEHEKPCYMKKYDSAYSYDMVTKSYYEQAFNYDDVAKMQYIDMNTWLKGDILVKSYRMTRAHSLELRTPFLDKKVFEIASKLTLGDKIKGRATKYMLRQAFSGLLPNDVIKREKLGYPVPIRVWLKDEIYDWAVNIVKKSNTEEYINKNEVLKLIVEHQKGKLDNSRKIWTILTFMIWHEVFIEGTNTLGNQF